METTENNKLIAEFMEFKQCKGIRSEFGKYFDYWAKENFSCIEEQEIEIESQWGWGLVEQNFLFAEQLKFHTDWNWLMQVVDKIFSTDLYYEEYIDYNASMFTNGQIELSASIKHVYDQCVEFVKWYNEQKK
jgi:hypothetical protein